MSWFGMWDGFDEEMQNAPDIFARKPQANADRIRGMTDEELARHYAKRIAQCYGCEAVTEDDCFECQMEWLKAPADKEGE